MASNLFKRFIALLPQNPLRVGEVIAVTDTTCVIQEMGGGTITVRGTSTLGARVYFRNGTIEGPAPNLTYVTAEE